MEAVYQVAQSIYLILVRGTGLEENMFSGKFVVMKYGPN